MNLINLTGCIVVAFGLTGCVIKSGSSIRTGDVMPATSSDQVKIYLEKPNNYKTLGIVTGKGSHAFVSEQTHMDAALERMKQEAAKLGANGILLGSADNVGANNAVGQVIGNTIISSRATDAVTKGVAIYVVEE